MNYNHYGRTGKLVSEIGFGSWQLGNAKDWSTMTEDDAIHLVQEAIQLGINFFDTAPNYGLGMSETLLGKALKGKREQVVINTKFGHHTNDKQDFNANLIRQSIEDSLKRLQTTYLDSVLLHNPPFEVLNGSGGHFKVLEALRQEGKILDYGVSIDSTREILEVIEHTECGVIEVMYNMFHQETAEGIRKASEQGVSVIAKVPLDSGWLTGKYDKQSMFNDIRSRWSKEIIERRFTMLEAIKEIVGDNTVLSQKALQFILANKGISTVIPGVKNSDQLHSNVNAKNQQMEQSIYSQLVDFYETEIRSNPLPW